MLGQNKIINRINNLTLDTMPHSLLILGDKGSGRHTVFNMMVDKLGLPCFDITNKISQDMIDEIYLKVEPIIYLIDINNITVKESNMILKLVEEPFNNAYMVFIGKTWANVIPTILNRCQIWEMERYSEEELKYFMSVLYDNYADYLYLIDFCTTPGQILYIKQSGADTVQQMKSMAEKIIDYIGGANFANILTISDKIAFKDEQDKWDYDIFVKVLHKTIKHRMIESYSKPLEKMFITTTQLLKDTEIPHIDKKYLFEDYLCHCKYIMR